MMLEFGYTKQTAKWRSQICIMEAKLKSYNEVLEELSASEEECHLLLGNGFNLSLGIKTDYASIFEGMKKGYPGYSEVEDFLQQNDYDIESLINNLQGKVTNDDFLCSFIANKVKFDFMKATFSIAKDEIKNIYQDKNKEIHLLLKNFTNYFSLNYDPFLYLLLMKFKGDQLGDAVAFQLTFEFQKEILKELYDTLKQARQRGHFEVKSPGRITTQDLKICTKSEFTFLAKKHYKDHWTKTEIEKACELLWAEESGEEILEKINDGFLTVERGGNRQSHFSDSELQNVFFIHGAFHIYKDGRYIRKITQKQNKALYERLESIINNDEEELVCVLAGESEHKEESINDNAYLKKGFEKLSALNGVLVILGSSLAEQDKHIFDQINKSEISDIYISTNDKKKTANMRRAQRIFPDKKLSFFDYETISYSSIPE